MLDRNIENQLVNNPLQYRSILTIPKNIRIGLELELESINPEKVYNLIRKQIGTHWLTKTDKSLIKGQSTEIVSPVLTNNKNCWEVLEKLGELLERIKPTFDNCSFQVNFDGSLLPTAEERLIFLKLYAFYEDIIYRFSKGENEHYRDSLDTYASPIILSLKDTLYFGEDDKDLILERFNNQKRYGISFKTQKKDLIEFRTPNGTYNPILWQNYITLFYYLIMCVVNRKYNIQELDSYINSYSKLNILESYELPREEKALKLSKQIFLNQNDRIYFLHQYLRK